MIFCLYWSFIICLAIDEVWTMFVTGYVVAEFIVVRQKGN